MIKHGNASAHAQNRQCGSQSHTYQMPDEKQADSNGDADIAEVEAVLRKAHGFMNAVCNGLYNTVTGVRDDPHVQGHGSADAGQGNAEQQKDLDQHEKRIQCKGGISEVFVFRMIPRARMRSPRM